MGLNFMNTASTRSDDQNPSALEERLKRVIAQRGPISIADYMADALTHPHDGYYMNEVALGKDGDFITAPEVSQLFGELIGLWLVEAWHNLGSPEQFNLVELGPGRGVLMDDILRVARLRPAFLKAVRITLVEMSGRLRHEQQKRLKRHHDVDVNWADSFEDCPGGPLLIVANEFFDCMPIQQFIKTKLGWHERIVGLDPVEDVLKFDKTPAPLLLDHPLAVDAPIDSIIEHSVGAMQLSAKISKRLCEFSGRALIIDYGPWSSGYGDTFQGVRDHEFWPPLKSPGKADLTAHVDFQRLADASLHEGADCFGPVSQGQFLSELGLHHRVNALSQGKSPEEQTAIHHGAHRLTDPSQMGELFKVLCLSSPGLEPPAGFSAKEAK